MYGLVNAAIEELVLEKAGAEAWKKIKEKAGVSVESFNRMAPYPDELTVRLVSAASEVLGMPAEEVLRVFGRFWVLFTGRNGYGHMFRMAGNSFVGFLANLDNLHSRVGLNFPELRPPSFQVEEERGPGLIRLHYLSDRQGLCPMVVGLLEGLSEMFHTPVDITHPVCQIHGADHCEFLLALGHSHG